MARTDSAYLECPCDGEYIRSLGGGAEKDFSRALAFTTQPVWGVGVVVCVGVCGVGVVEVCVWVWRFEGGVGGGKREEGE